MKKKPELKVGQTIYITENSLFFKNEPTNPEPYEVTSVNTRSIYASPVGRSHITIRFEKRTWECNDFGYVKRIWITPSDYFNARKRSENKKVLRSKIAGNLSSLSLEELRTIAATMELEIEEK